MLCVDVTGRKEKKVPLNYHPVACRSLWRWILFEAFDSGADIVPSFWFSHRNSTFFNTLET